LALCLEFPSLSAFGETTEEALHEIKFVVEESIKWMIEEEEKIPEPIGSSQFKGKIALRVPSEIHRKLVIESSEQGVSLNQYILF
jgi:predicted HicB family RNase H-like nuclease